MMILVSIYQKTFHSLFWRYLEKFRTWSLARKFGPVFSPTDMSLFNWHYFLNNGKYLKNLDMHFKEASITNDFGPVFFGPVFFRAVLSNATTPLHRVVKRKLPEVVAESQFR